MSPNPEHTLLTDRRLAPRTTVRCRLDVTHLNGRFLGCLVDMSTGGMRVRCAPGADLEAVEHLRIELQRWIGLGEHLTLAGHFAWCKPADLNGWFEAGFALVGLSRDERERVEALVKRLEQAAREDSWRTPA